MVGDMDSLNFALHTHDKISALQCGADRSVWYGLGTDDRVVWTWCGLVESSGDSKGLVKKSTFNSRRTQPSR